MVSCLQSDPWKSFFCLQMKAMITDFKVYSEFAVRFCSLHCSILKTSFY